MEDDRLIDCGGMVVGGGGGGGEAFVTSFNPRRPSTSTGITTVLYYLNLWIYHRSLLVIMLMPCQPSLRLPVIVVPWAFVNKLS